MRLLLLPLAFLLAGCPETVGQQCPSNSVPLGQFTLNFVRQDVATDCKQTLFPDGGAADASIGADTSTQSATLCAGPGGDAGATLLSLAVPGKALRTSGLADGGFFEFRGTTDPTSGTVCICALAVEETFGGQLLAPGNVAADFLADGGLPLITSLDGGLVDKVTTPQGPCACNVPCAITYKATGTRL